MGKLAPTVSILITTYNRSRLLRRAVNSVLMQDYIDFELVVIDDCSSDDTREVIASIDDPRIRYIRNETNVGATQGDRVHMRRFVYELMRGQYFAYLCDDDYWLLPDLLSRQVETFQSHGGIVMVMGGQLSYFLTTPDSYLDHSPDDTLTFTLENISDYFDLNTLTPKTKHVYFMEGPGKDKSLFTKKWMTSEEFLEEFSEEPAGKNIIGGAMLYSRDLFIKAGGFAAPVGSQWQAGYELKMGPACYGGTVYFNEPSIVTEIRASNASFRGTQVEHFLDSILSVEVAFAVPLASRELSTKRRFLRYIRAKTVRNLSRAYLRNTMAIRSGGALTMCSDENMADPVTYRQVGAALFRNNALHLIRGIDLKLMIGSAVPDWLFEILYSKRSAI